MDHFGSSRIATGSRESLRFSLRTGTHLTAITCKKFSETVLELGSLMATFSGQRLTRRPFLGRLFGLVILLLVLPSWSSAAAQQEFPRTIAPFLKKHCYACHGPQKQEANLRYDQLDGFQIANRHLWTMVHQRLSAGEMPPEDRPQPGSQEKKAVLGWIEQQQRALGAGSTRRLNRRELSAALQDLTGLSVDYADSLPGDGKLAGFDTGADALQDAASSVAQIMRVTRRAVDGIRFLEPPPGEVFTATLSEATDTRKAFDAWKKAGAYAKPRGHLEKGVGLYLEPKWVGDRGGLEFNVPPPPNRKGVLRLKLVVSAKKFFPGLPNPRLWVTIGGKTIDYAEITGTTKDPEQLIYEVQVDDLAVEPRGLGVRLTNRVELPYAVEGFANEDKSKPEDKIPGGVGLFRPVYNRKSPPEEQPVPFVILHSLKIQPHYVAPWPPGNWHIDLRPIQNDQASASRLLDVWIRKAWRRPVEESEQKRFLALYEKLLGQNLSFDEALRATFHSVLLSASFRYLAAPADPDPVRAQYAIASRLSFLLVGSPPDQQLLALAAAGKLRESAVLSAQVDRLLDDPQSDAFLRPFVVQWLEIGQPITITMSHIKKQDFRFGRYLKESMREETTAYIKQLFAENRPARELIDSNWTMMNDILAMHYGYEGIEGGQLRKVVLRQNDPRGGGILGHAGIQSMLCWMGDNWVIYRGAWTLRHILDDPPPPPPLEVPELDPSAGNNRGKTFKELLQQHQENAKCAVCHKSMDPLGFAFQNFDLSGRWRDVEYERYTRNELDGKIEWSGVGETRPVDTTGALPRGEEFRTYAEFKQLVVKHYIKDLVRGLMKNLFVYATGGKPDVDDLAEIEQILKSQEPRGYPLRELLQGVVRSKAFLGHDLRLSTRLRSGD